MKKRLVVFSLILTLISASFVGCTQKEVVKETLSESVVEENTDVKETAEPAKRVVIDQLGREVTLPEEVNRVVTTYSPVTYYTLAIGGQEKLVGVNSHSAENKFLTGVYPEIVNIPTVGSKKNGHNMETIVSINPDVVILYDGKGMDEMYNQLSEQGIAAVTIVPESVEDMKEAAKILGVVFNREEQAKKVIDAYEDIVALIEERIGDIPEEERKTVYMTGSSTLKTISRDLYQHYMLETVGGVSVSKELTGYFHQVSAEQVVKWNPDVIFSISNNREGTVESIMTDPQFATINAIKNEDVYKVPSVLGAWDYPEPRSALGLLWMATKLYPERFEDINLMDKVNEFHMDFFGKTYEELGGTQEELEGK